MKRNSGNILLTVLVVIGVIVISVVGGFFWLRWNWKTYTNQHYQFTLNYPAKWDLVEEKLKNGDFWIYFKTHRYDPVPEPYPSITIKNNWTLEEEIKSHEPEKCPPQPTNCVQLQSGVSNIEKFYLNSLSGTRFLNFTQEGIESQITVFNKGTTVYVLSDQKLDKDFDQILSTFKFL